MAEDTAPVRGGGEKHEVTISFLFAPFGIMGLVLSLFVQTCTPPQMFKPVGSLPISCGFAGPRMIAQGAFKPSPFTKKQE